MKYNNDQGNLDLFVPTESTIIALWKRAAKHPGQWVQHLNLSCRLETVEADNHKGSSSGSSAPLSISAMSSKREILTYLQSVCSVDFLRKYRLNSSIEVVARKANKNMLLDVWEKWKNEDLDLAESSRLIATKDYSSLLEPLLRHLLRPTSDAIQQVTAATLHESSENELPCWDEDLDDDLLNGSSSVSAMASQQIVLFLGAVRDMTSVENQALKRVCCEGSRINRGKIPVLQIRLGPVAEFTSKILSVVGFHHHHGRLVPSVLQMLRREQTSVSTQPLLYADTPATPSPILHFVCFVPISRHEISPHIADRNSTLWSMVRCTVACLWRSRLAGGSRSAVANTTVRNRLTFLFTDGAILTLDQEEFVVSMAEKHLAAPSEHQILLALQKAANSLSRTDTIVHGNNDASSDLDWKATSRATVRLLLQDTNKGQCKSRAENGSMVALDFVNSTTNAHDRHIFYSRCDLSGNRVALMPLSILILLSISSQNEANGSNGGEPTACSLLLDRRRTLLVRALQRKRISVLHGRSLLNTGFRCIDQLASIVTMLQHLCYQERLFGLLQHIIMQSMSQRLPEKRRREGDS